MLKKFFIFTALVFLANCSAKRESPVVYLSNASPEPIANIRCDWPDGNVLTLAGLDPGDSRSQSFYIRRDSDFFGTINVSWTNAKGEAQKKAFNLRKEHLPSISDHTTYSFVQLYIDQEDLEIVTSDIPDLGGKNRRMEAMLAKYHNDYALSHGKGQSALIAIQPKKDNSLPYWLNAGMDN